METLKSEHCTNAKANVDMAIMAANVLRPKSPIYMKFSCNNPPYSWKKHINLGPKSPRNRLTLNPGPTCIGYNTL